METLSGTSHNMAYETRWESFSPAFLIRRAYTCLMVGVIRPTVPFAMAADRSTWCTCGPRHATNEAQKRTCSNDIIGDGPQSLRPGGPKSGLNGLGTDLDLTRQKGRGPCGQKPQRVFHLLIDVTPSMWHCVWLECACNDIIGIEATLLTAGSSERLLLRKADSNLIRGRLM